MTPAHFILLMFTFVLGAFLLVELFLPIRRKDAEEKPAEPTPSDFDAWFEAHSKRPYPGERAACLEAWKAGQQATRKGLRQDDAGGKV